MVQQHGGTAVRMIEGNLSSENYPVALHTRILPSTPSHLVLEVVVLPLRVQEVMHGDHVVRLAHDTRPHSSKLLKGHGGSRKGVGANNVL